jgi:hypothetical protein
MEQASRRARSQSHPAQARISVFGENDRRKACPQASPWFGVPLDLGVSGASSQAAEFQRRLFTPHIWKLMFLRLGMALSPLVYEPVGNEWDGLYLL